MPWSCLRLWSRLRGGSQHAGFTPTRPLKRAKQPGGSSLQLEPPELVECVVCKREVAQQLARRGGRSRRGEGGGEGGGRPRRRRRLRAAEQRTCDAASANTAAKQGGVRPPQAAALGPQAAARHAAAPAGDRTMHVLCARAVHVLHVHVPPRMRGECAVQKRGSSTQRLAAWRMLRQWRCSGGEQARPRNSPSPSCMHDGPDASSMLR